MFDTKRDHVSYSKGPLMGDFFAAGNFFFVNFPDGRQNGRCANRKLKTLNRVRSFLLEFCPCLCLCHPCWHHLRPWFRHPAPAHVPVQPLLLKPP